MVQTFPASGWKLSQEFFYSLKVSLHWSQVNFKYRINENQLWRTITINTELSRSDFVQSIFRKDRESADACPNTAAQGDRLAHIGKYFRCLTSPEVHQSLIPSFFGE